MSTLLHKLRVGIVDDDDDSRFLVRYWLEMHGYEVRDWARPKDLLAFLPEDRVDLFLIDIRLPEMDGLSLAHEVRPPPPNLAVNAWFDLPTIIFELREVSPPQLRR